MTAQPRTTGDIPDDQTAGTPGAPPRAATAQGPVLREFLAGPETRLRDLVAFGMAAEAGRPLAPDGIEALRRQADADLEAHAFRVLHNQVETIRRQAVDEQIGRMGRGLGFGAAVLANLVALALVGGGVALVLTGTLPLEAGALAPVTDRLAQLLAPLSSR